MAARLLVLAPAVAVVALDFALRGPLLLAFTKEAWQWYAGCALVGAVAWGALTVAAARTEGPARWVARVLLASLALLAVGTQLQTWVRYRSFLNWRPALMGNSLWPCVAQELWSDRLQVLALLLAPVVVALGLAATMSRLSPPSGWGARIALPLGVAALAGAVVYAKPDGGWDTGTTPDVLWLSAVGALAKSMQTHEDVMVTLAHLPGARSPSSVPSFAPRPSRRRNVLLVIDESVRAEDVCSIPTDGGCERTPFTNELLPDRFGLTQMRALDSTTALSLSTIFTGHGPDEPRDVLLGAPSIFEIAHAGGVDAAFWTSQNLLYANAGRYLDGAPMRFFVPGTALEPYADYLDGADDARLLERVLSDLPSLHEPYLAVVQLANTHFPYKVDDHDLPFSRSRDWKHMDDFGKTEVRYSDALHRQDKLLARFLARVPRERTVVVFLSDHGEQLGEHRRIGHTWTEYEEEVHVPMWLDAAPEALAPEEARQLASLRETPLTMLDVAPTLLDLLGAWEEPSLAPVRAPLRGVSLLRRAPPLERAVVMTNCSELFSCSSPNWGAMKGTRKLLASAEDKAWRCFDVGDDPGELHDLGAAACADLQALAEGGGRGRPF